MKTQTRFLSKEKAEKEASRRTLNEQQLSRSHRHSSGFAYASYKTKKKYFWYEIVQEK